MFKLKWGCKQSSQTLRGLFYDMIMTSYAHRHISYIIYMVYMVYSVRVF